MDGALWEYTFRGMHAVNLGFVASQRGYALNLVAPGSGWAEARALFERFKHSFRVTARA